MIVIIDTELIDTCIMDDSDDIIDTELIDTCIIDDSDDKYGVQARMTPLVIESVGVRPSIIDKRRKGMEA